MTTQETNEVTASTVEIVRNYLTSAAGEMQRTLIRTAFNTILYEVRDFGISIYDADLNLIADSPGLALFLGANDYSIEKALERVDEKSLENGDILFMNYPYWSSRHPNDACLFAPVFVDGRLVGYVFVRAHWIDIGAKDPGYVLDSTDVHQEGALFPPIKLYRAGDRDDQLLEIIRFNSRMPEKVVGDLNAQVAALKTGVERLRELHQKYGTDTVEACTDRILAHGEHQTREALADLPNGSWTAVDYIDNDGVNDDPVRIEATVTITDDRFAVDFSDSSDVVDGPVNVPIGMTETICKLCLKSLTTPTQPSNGGQYEPLTITAPEDNLFNATYPDPTFAVSTAMLGVNVVYEALAKGLPDRVPASTGGDICSIIVYRTNTTSDRMFVEVNNEAVGWGASRDQDGENGLMHITESRVRNVPVEVIEQNVPSVRLNRVELRQDSGGAGERRGGLGVRRDYEFVREGEALSVVKKTRTDGWGHEGGEPGSRNVVALQVNDDWNDRIERFVVNDDLHSDPDYVHTGMMRGQFERGEVVSNRSGGGGGYGDPIDRDPERVREDILDGYVSREAARETYGVVIDQHGEIDWEQTETLRERQW